MTHPAYARSWVVGKGSLSVLRPSLAPALPRGSGGSG
jgi:hypothetical protein